MTVCYVCGKERLVKKSVDFKVCGVSLGKFDAQVCAKRSETYFSEEISDKMDAISKKKGL